MRPERTCNSGMARITERLKQRLEVPTPRLGRAAGLGHVDAGVVQADGSEFQVPAEERGDPRHGFERSHVGDGLDADGGVLVDHHVIDRKARAGEQAEVDGPQFDLAAQRAFERRANARRETVATQVRRGDAHRQKHHQGDAQPLCRALYACASRAAPGDAAWHKPPGSSISASIPGSSTSM